MGRDRNGNPEGGGSSGGKDMALVLLAFLFIALIASPAVAVKKGNKYVWALILAIFFSWLIYLISRS